MTTAWKRLRPWLPGGEPPADGEAALRALADVTEVRRTLDRAELAAVRTARRHGRSWTEIATMLAITRQSAWERWRDLDDPAAATATGPAAPAEAVLAAAGDDLVTALVESVTGPAKRRRAATVPDVVGLTAADALDILTRAGFVAESATPGLALTERLDDAHPVVVVRQYPEPGVRVKGAATVRVWLERGDGEAGVREPRRPSPTPRAAAAELSEAG